MNTGAPLAVEVACDWLMWSIELEDYQMLPIAAKWLIAAMEWSAEG